MIRQAVKKIDNNFTKKAFLAATALLVISAFSYLYFLNSAILNAVERKSVEKEIAGLNEQALSLETKYINLESGIDLGMARQLGFVENPKKAFVSRKSVSRSVSLNNEI